MQKKERLRRKFYFVRKKKYFEIKSNFFNPLIRLIKKKNNKKIINLSIYYPSSFELNISRLFEINLKNNFKMFLPVINKNSSMYFYEWKNKDVLQVNKFGMLEPYVRSKHIVPNFMLVPLLAYDNNKNRLGYGKGFYDRYLKKYLDKNNNITTIGIAFSFQKHHKLPRDKNDVKLNFILTEKGIY